MNLARSSIKLFAANVGTAVLQFLGLAYFARELGPAPLGVFFLFQALLGMVSIPADFGLRGAVEKRISEGKSRGAFLSTALVMKIIPIIIVSILIIVFGDFVNHYVGADIAFLLVVAASLKEMSQLSVFVLKGELRVNETAVLRVAQQGVWLVSGIFLVDQGFGYLALIYGLLAGFCLVLIWGWYKVSITPRRPSRRCGRSLFQYGKHNIISSIGGYFYNWMDVAIIGLFLTQAHVGAYEIAWRVASVMTLLSRSIATTIFPQISEWSSNDNYKMVEDILPQALTPSLILVIPAFFGAILLSGDILRVVFGAEYTIAAPVLIILMFDQITEAGQVVLGRSLQAVDRPDLAARATLVGVALNLILNFTFIPAFGITGAAIATMVASLISGLVLHGLYLSRIVSIQVPYRELLISVASAISMGVLLNEVSSRIVISSIMELLAIIGSGAAIYAIGLLLSPSIRTKVVSGSRSLLRCRTQ